ncbi:MAG: hypothetical protein AAGB51_06115 [Planctomycetota bacterium]
MPSTQAIVAVVFSAMLTFVLAFDTAHAEPPDPPEPLGPADLTTTGATLDGVPGYGTPDGEVNLDDLGYFLGHYHNPPPKPLPAIVTDPAFVIYNEITYGRGVRNEPGAVPHVPPDWSWLGLRDIDVSYQRDEQTGAFLWGVDGNGAEVAFDYDGIEAWAARRAGDPNAVLVLDIEHLPMRVLVHGTETVDESISKIVRAIEAAKRGAPDAVVGVYGNAPPIIDYNAPLQAVLRPGGDRELTREHWIVQSRYLSPIAEAADALFPALPAQDIDRPDEWAIFAEAIIEAALEHGKPVLPFLPVEFHPASVSAGRFIPPDQFRAMLELVARDCNGVVIWTAGGPTPWPEVQDRRFAAELANFIQQRGLKR